MNELKDKVSDNIEDKKGILVILNEGFLYKAFFFVY